MALSKLQRKEGREGRGQESFADWEGDPDSQIPSRGKKGFAAGQGTGETLVPKSTTLPTSGPGLRYPLFLLTGLLENMDLVCGSTEVPYAIPQNKPDVSTQTRKGWATVSLPVHGRERKTILE